MVHTYYVHSKKLTISTLRATYLANMCMWCVRLYVCMHVCIYKSPLLSSSIVYEYNSSDPKQNKYIILIHAHFTREGDSDNLTELCP